MTPPVEWHDNAPTFPDFLPTHKDLNVPELTGRRRYRCLRGRGWDGGMILEVEEAVYTEVSGKRGWEIQWRPAKPVDVSEDVV